MNVSPHIIAAINDLLDRYYELGRIRNEIRKTVKGFASIYELDLQVLLRERTGLPHHTSDVPAPPPVKTAPKPKRVSLPPMAEYPYGRSTRDQIEFVVRAFGEAKTGDIVNAIRTVGKVSITKSTIRYHLGVLADEGILEHVVEENPNESFYKYVGKEKGEDVSLFRLEDDLPKVDESDGYPRNGVLADKIIFTVGEINRFVPRTDIDARLDKREGGVSRNSMSFAVSTMYTKGQLVRLRVNESSNQSYYGLDRMVERGHGGRIVLKSPDYAPSGDFNLRDVNTIEIEMKDVFYEKYEGHAECSMALGIHGGDGVVGEVPPRAGSIPSRAIPATASFRGPISDS